MHPDSGLSERQLYWYNGSMYYTGFFAVTLFFLGTLLRYLYNGKKILMLPLLLFAIFLGGGNYVSLLPCMLFDGNRNLSTAVAEK